ncbi:hypothetical protein A3746_17615 [Oleibacter sp. HI0075]|nr:hypothetical protein A3746_17615 [Oleibacter sp. HI0075]
MGTIAVNLFDYVMVAWLCLLIVTCVSWVLFSRKNLNALEERAKKAGFYEQEPVDVTGTRVLIISNVLVLPAFVARRFEGTPLEQISKMRLYASVADRRSALILVLAMHTLALLTLAIYFLPVRYQ